MHVRLSVCERTGTSNEVCPSLLLQEWRRILALEPGHSARRVSNARNSGGIRMHVDRTTDLAEWGRSRSWRIDLWGLVRGLVLLCLLPHRSYDIPPCHSRFLPRLTEGTGDLRSGSFPGQPAAPPGSAPSLCPSDASNSSLIGLNQSRRSTQHVRRPKGFLLHVSVIVANSTACAGILVFRSGGSFRFLLQAIVIAFLQLLVAFGFAP